MTWLRLTHRPLTLIAALVTSSVAAAETPLGAQDKLLSCLVGLEHATYHATRPIYPVDRTSGPQGVPSSWGVVRHKRGRQEGYLFFNDQKTEFVALPAYDPQYPASRAMITLSDGTVFKCDKLGADALRCPYEVMLASNTGDPGMDRSRRRYNEDSESLSIEIARLPLPERIARYEKESKITFKKNDDVGRMVSRWVVTSGSPATVTEVASLRGLAERQIIGSLANYVMDYRQAWKDRIRDLELQKLMASPDYKPQSGLLGLVNKMHGNHPKSAPDAELWSLGLNRCAQVDSEAIRQQILGLQAALRATSIEFAARERQLASGTSCPAR